MENIQYVSGRDSSTTQSWAKNGRVYSSDSASSLMPDSLTSNSFFIPSNHIPVRFVRWPHIPQIMRPSFTNNRLFSHYRTVQGMMPVYPCSHLTGTSILSQPSEMTTNVPSELNSLAENSFSDDSSVIYEQCSEAISENITRSNGDISQNNVLFVNETNNSDNERENAEHILTEITKEHEDTTEKDIIENEESYSNCMDEKDHENMSYALNDIAYEIEVETNNENDLINEVLNESYSEENDESEKITFNTIEEVLTAIDDSKQNQDYSLPFELSGETSRLNIKMVPYYAFLYYYCICPCVHQFTQTEKLGMILVHGEYQQNTKNAVSRYRELYPDRQPPSRQTVVNVCSKLLESLGIQGRKTTGTATDEEHTVSSNAAIAHMGVLEV